MHWILQNHREEAEDEVSMRVPKEDRQGFCFTDLESGGGMKRATLCPTHDSEKEVRTAACALPQAFEVITRNHDLEAVGCG